jgi:hypothetical protein
MSAARKLGSVGDINPIEHGGGYVLAYPNDSTPVLEYFDGLESIREEEIDLDNPEHLKLTATLYRVDVPHDAHALMRDFDWVDWIAVERSTGVDLVPAQLDRSVTARADAIVDAAGYYGWHELDTYPLTLTLGELIKRWKEF